MNAIRTQRKVRFTVDFDVSPDNPLTDDELRRLTFAVRNMVLVQVVGAMNMVPLAAPGFDLSQLISIEHTAPRLEVPQ